MEIANGKEPYHISSRLFLATLNWVAIRRTGLKSDLAHFRCSIRKLFLISFIPRSNLVFQGEGEDHVTGGDCNLLLSSA
jgi:hypothetical protein